MDVPYLLILLDNRIRPVKADLFESDYSEKIAPRVIDERIHFLINDMLKDVVQQGTAKQAKSLNRSDLAGKTGTTNDQIDAWFNGYQKGIVVQFGSVLINRNLGGQSSVVVPLSQ